MSERRRDYLLFLEDILNAIEKIERYTKGLKKYSFSKKQHNESAAGRTARCEIVEAACAVFPTKWSSICFFIVHRPSRRRSSFVPRSVMLPSS